MSETAQKAKPSRNEIRAKVFSSRNKKAKIIDFYGVEIELRQPTVGELKKTTADADDPNSVALANILINFAYVPGTEEKVFEDADKDSIANLPAGKETLAIVNAIQELTGLELQSAVKN